MGKRGAAFIGAIVLAITLCGAGTAAAEEPILGPEGYKALQLGQTESDAIATGLIENGGPDPACHIFDLIPSEGKRNPGSGVFIDKDKGIVMIGGTDKSHTPDGLTLGSTMDEVRAAHPDLTHVPPMDFVYTASVDGNPDAKYRFAFDEADRVSDFALQSADMASCDS